MYLLANTIVTPNAKKSTNSPSPSAFIGTCSKKKIFIVSFNNESVYVLNPLTTLAAPENV